MLDLGVAGDGLTTESPEEGGEEAADMRSQVNTRADEKEKGQRTDVANLVHLRER